MSPYDTYSDIKRLDQAPPEFGLLSSIMDDPPMTLINSLVLDLRAYRYFILRSSIQMNPAYKWKCDEDFTLYPDSP